MSLRGRTDLAALAALVCLAPLAAAAEEPPNPVLDAEDSALAALALSLAVAPLPQQPEPEPERGGAATGAPRIELVVTVAARSIVFEELPRVRMAFGGPEPRLAVWRVERTNLPARVEPGVEYRDVRVRLTLSSTVDEFESLMEDARSVASGIRMEESAP